MCLIAKPIRTFLWKCKFWQREFTVYKVLKIVDGVLRTPFQSTPITSNELVAEGNIGKRDEFLSNHYYSGSVYRDGIIHTFLTKKGATRFVANSWSEAVLECKAKKKDFIVAGWFDECYEYGLSGGFLKITIPQEEIDRVLKEYYIRENRSKP